MGNHSLIVAKSKAQFRDATGCRYAPLRVNAAHAPAHFAFGLIKFDSECFFVVGGHLHRHIVSEIKR